ncbi:hypothetical protein N7516_001217 [Penicillium verrucosum]|uniref:uncharacterized protein n=1 Tax=Penicillium verrucosum TaxID=60171 RepID=UPI00254561AC|nr:uncharacterized protein N7516_001217 [Penicillium verrucosum]KAJ5941049.1 hypothetical protein N7516_001217 [Penicillium verrucosum]
MVNASPDPSGQPKQASNSFQESNDITPEHAPPCLPAEPSPHHLFEQALLSNFIESFSQSGSKLTQPDSWTRYLLSWISSSKTLRSSIRATTLAFYAQVSKQKALCHEAGQYYACALHGQRIYMSQWLAGFNRPAIAAQEIPTDQDICTSLMLMYYELINPAATGSWLAHLRGTAQLLVLRGPQNCQVGAVHLIFRSVRLLLAQTSIRTQEQSCFASSDWCEIPFAHSKKTALDVILDVIHKIVGLLQRYKSGEEYKNEDPRSILGLLENLTESLTNSERMYLRELHESYSTQTIASNCLAFQSIEFERLNDEIWLGGGDFCSAIPAVMFHSIQIMINDLKLKLQMAAENHVVVESEAVIRASDLLDFADTLFQRDLQSRLNDGSCMQLVFPLEMVRRHSLSEKQKTRAMAYLHRLGWKDEEDEEEPWI